MPNWSARWWTRLAPRMGRKTTGPKTSGITTPCKKRCGGGLPDVDPERGLTDQDVKLATTLGGATVVHGDRTLECRTGRQGAGCAWRQGWEGSRSDQRPAVYPRTPRSDAEAGRGEAAARA